MSAEEFLEVVSEASVFDRGRNGEWDEGDVGAFDEENAGCEGERVEASDPTECERELIGTVRLWT